MLFDLEQPHIRAPLHRRPQPAQAWDLVRLSPSGHLWGTPPRRIDRLLVPGRLELGLAGQHLVARQAATLHRCFPEGKQLMTGNRTRANAFLRDVKFGNPTSTLDRPLPGYYGMARTSGKELRAGLFEGDQQGAVCVLTWSGCTRTPGRAPRGLRRHRETLEPAPLHALERTRGSRWCPLRARGTTKPTRKRTPSRRFGTGELVLIHPGRAGPSRERPTRADPRRDRRSGQQDLPSIPSRICSSRALAIGPVRPG